MRRSATIRAGEEACRCKIGNGVHPYSGLWSDLVDLAEPEQAGRHAEVTSTTILMLGNRISAAVIMSRLMAMTVHKVQPCVEIPQQEQR